MADENKTAVEKIDDFIASLTDWRGTTLASLRRVILDSDPEIVEEWKWRGAPVWSLGGIICVANAYKDKVKVTFYEGASLPDPDRLFNNGLDGGQWRTIDLFENDRVNEGSLKSLVCAAISHNLGKVKKTGSRTQKKL